MSIVGLLCLLFAAITALVLVLYALQRRDLHKLSDLSQQLQRIAIGGRLPGRVSVSSDNPELAAFVTAVNHLLTRAAPTAETDTAQAPKLFADLGDRIHEAVLVHREVILYANRQFASFVGVDRVELVGRRLADLVPPEFGNHTPPFPENTQGTAGCPHLAHESGRVVSRISRDVASRFFEVG